MVLVFKDKSLGFVTIDSACVNPNQDEVGAMFFR